MSSESSLLSGRICLPSRASLEPSLRPSLGGVRKVGSGRYQYRHGRENCNPQRLQSWHCLKRPTDPSYVSLNDAKNLGLTDTASDGSFIMRADAETQASGRGRNSVRISSKARFADVSLAEVVGWGFS